MARACTATILTAVCLCLAAACGGSSTHTTSRTAVTLPSSPVETSGEAVFAHSCSACHSLIGNESLRKQGGDLLNYKLTEAQLISFTRVMPAHLTTAQLHAVVRYILRAQAKAGR